MTWNVYLSGEIHTDWRETIETAARAAGLDVTFTAPVTDHAASDDCGVAILGAEDNKFWHDRKGAGVNAIRTRTLIEKADVVVVRFGDKYKQWNAAFDAGLCGGPGQGADHPAPARACPRAQGSRRGRPGRGRDAGTSRADPGVLPDGQAVGITN